MKQATARAAANCFSVRSISEGLYGSGSVEPRLLWGQKLVSAGALFSSAHRLWHPHRMNTAETNGLIAVIQTLVRDRDDLRAMAVCGSWARGNPRPDSDLDVLIIAQDPGSLRRHQEWMRELRFSDAGFRYLAHHSAQYGAVWSAHIKLEPEAELELTFAAESWASVRLIDPGTRRVVTDAFKILIDKDGALRSLSDACS